MMMWLAVIGAGVVLAAVVLIVGVFIWDWVTMPSIETLNNGHDFRTTQYATNKRIEITCRRCGYMHTDVKLTGSGYLPYQPVETPCPVDV